MDNFRPRKARVLTTDGFINSSSPISASKHHQAKIARTNPIIQRQSNPNNSNLTTTLPLSTSYTPEKLSLRPLNEPRNRNDQRLNRPVRKQHKRFALKKAVILLTLTVFLTFLSSAGWMGWKFYRNTSRLTHNNNPLSALGIFQHSPLKGEERGRVNILIAGNSADDQGHDGADLTDSIMVLSIDTYNHQAYMLSIPRDTWVNIPHYGHAKINEAILSTKFKEDGYPNGGMGMLEKVINNNLGIPIDYFALVNYAAFRDSVNAIGGITVNIKSEDPRGLYDPNIGRTEGGPLKLPNGPVYLNGQTALNLARARGDPTFDGRVEYGFSRSDFDRTQHQRQMAFALKDKVLSTGVLSDPIKIGNLLDSVGKNVKTDLQLKELESLYQLAKNINNTNIKSFSLDKISGKQNLLKNYNTATGQLALIPSAGIDDFNQIASAIKTISSNDPVVKDSASVVVLNGSNLYGLATKQSTVLGAKGLNVVSVADAPKSYTTTTIIDNTTNTKSDTKKLLTTLYGNNILADKKLSSLYSADFIVILGQNFTTTPQQ
ncbi:MAG: hypothetical protein NVS3B23_07450 [Candidatus Saccharimonadales bacterium]